MRKLIERTAAIAALATALAASGAGNARASLVTYTETATVSGSLGSTTFTDATITITQTADTASGVMTSPLTHALYIRDTTATLLLTGGDLTSPLSASFTFTTYTVAGTSGSVGVGQRVGPPAFGFTPQILAALGAAPGYDLISSIGPVSGPAFIQPDTSITYGTTAGDLNLIEADGNAAFQAAAVPEPSSLALGVVAGAIGLASAVTRRVRRVGR